MAKTVADQLNDWHRRIYENIGRLTLSVPGKLVGDTEAQRLAAEEAFDGNGAFFREVLQEFRDQMLMNTGFSGSVGSMFSEKQNAGHEYTPEYFKRRDSSGIMRDKPDEATGDRMYEGKKGGFVDAEESETKTLADQIDLSSTVPVGNMKKGFDTIWKRLQQKHTVSAGDGKFGIGIGAYKDMTRDRLSDYMGQQGSNKTTTTGSRLNTLFYAIEYGTGVAENVGAGNVRTQGETKEPTLPGAWWLGFRHQRQDFWIGTLMKGQKGFHLFYDEANRTPNPAVNEFVGRYLPEYLDRKLADRFGNRLSRR